MFTFSLKNLAPKRLTLMPIHILEISVATSDFKYYSSIYCGPISYRVMITILTNSFSDASVEYIGSDLGPRGNIATGNVRGIFLFESMRFSTGIITSFHAYVLEYYPIRFQIWRRGGDSELTLVGEKRVTPIDPLGMLEVSIRKSKLFRFTKCTTRTPVPTFIGR